MSELLDKLKEVLEKNAGQVKIDLVPGDTAQAELISAMFLAYRREQDALLRRVDADEIAHAQAHRAAVEAHFAVVREHLKFSEERQVEEIAALKRLGDLLGELVDVVSRR